MSAYERYLAIASTPEEVEMAYEKAVQEVMKLEEDKRGEENLKVNAIIWTNFFCLIAPIVIGNTDGSWNIISSSVWTRDGNAFMFVPEFAIDDNVRIRNDLRTFSSDEENNPFVSIDLGKEYDVHSVLVYLRRVPLGYDQDMYRYEKFVLQVILLLLNFFTKQKSIHQY